MKSLKEFYLEFKTHEDFISVVEEELENICDEKPDFVYKNSIEDDCSYNSGPKTNCSGCLFGQAFQKLGVDTSNWCYGITTILNESGIKCPSKWLIIQNLQDSGVFWGKLFGLYKFLEKTIDKVYQDGITKA